MRLTRRHTRGPRPLLLGPARPPQSNNSGPANADACLRPFLTNARAKGFPVLLAETTPRYVGSLAVDGAWDKWFSPLLGLVKEFDDVIKGWCYM